MKKLLVCFFFFAFAFGSLYAQQTYSVDGLLAVSPEPNVIEYDVFRGQTGGPYDTLIATVPQSPNPTFSEVGLSGANCWAYKAINNLDLESVFSPESCVGPPGQPGAISLTVTVTATIP